MTVQSVHKVTVKLRDFINHPRVQFGLMKQISTWYQVCVSLDVLEDTDMATEAYLAGDGGNLTQHYLVIFGVLQAVYAQQDAAKTLRTALGFSLNFSEHPELVRAREARNDIAGHPTNRSGGTSFHAISQITLTHDSLQLVSNHADGRTEFKAVHVRELVQDHRRCLVDLLEQTVSELRERDMEHKQQFGQSRLSDVLPDNYDYYLGLISQATGEAVTSSQAATGPFGAATLRRGLESLPSILEERGLALDTYDPVAWSFRWCMFALDKLESYFAGGELDAQSAYVFSKFLAIELRELMGVLAEIDADYANTDSD